MRAPYSWLREYCAPDTTIAELEHVLTSSGTKVEAIHHHGVSAPEHVVIGKVVSCEQHPDADRLRVCGVDVGASEPVTIVCGAPNVAEGQTVVVAQPGTVMPNGMEIKQAKLRGVVSNGMICSESELGLAPESEGILALDIDAAPGTPALTLLPIADEVIEFEITPNRPDCLGVYGIAREIHAATGAPLAAPPWATDPGTPGGAPGGVTITIDAPELCPRFTARVFENVTIGPSPQWLRARLTAAGLRPISNVVDITNYVMLLVGHPLHAFDLDQVAGNQLTVRSAQAGEKVETLDGETRTLDAQMVVIEDADGPTSIAGVMGGARSEVSESTTRVLLEVASWIGPNIHRTAQKLALRSEASSRFAKGLAPEQALEAQAVATQLMLELTGARLVEGTIDVGPFGERQPEAPVLALPAERVSEVLGMPIDVAEQRTRLTALGFGVADVDGGLSVTVPPFRRGDVTREADLIEEVGRFALDALPATLPKRRGAAGRLPRELQLRRRALDALVDRGAYEIVGWSFTSPAVADRLRLDAGSPGRSFVTLENPMSDEHSVLRTSVLGSLLDAAAHNAARGAHDLTLTEQGSVYLATGEPLPQEHHVLGCLQTGRVRPVAWGAGSSPQTADIFTVKALMEAVLGALRVDFTVEQADAPFLHPGRSAKAMAGDVVLGWFGELHPLVAESWELPGAVAAFELDMGAVIERAVVVPRFTDVTTYPSVREDLAIVVDDARTASDVLQAVRDAGGTLLRDVALFDIYRGPQVGEGRYSIALALTFQAEDRTLTHEDVAPVHAEIVAALAAIGGELRA